MLLRIGLIIGVSFWINGLMAQASEMDSLRIALAGQQKGTEQWVSTLYEISRIHPDQDSAIVYGKQTLAAASKQKLGHLQVISYDHLARTFLNNRARIDSVEWFVAQGIAHSEQSPDSLLYKSSMTRTLGEYYRQKGDFDQALIYLEQAYQLIERGLEGSRPEERQELYLQKRIHIFTGFGNTYKNKGQCQEAIMYHQKAFNASKEIGYAEQMGFSTFNMAGCYFILGDYPRALAAYLRSMGMLEDKRNKQNMMSNISVAMGMIYAETGEYDSARLYFKKSLYIESEFQRIRRKIGAYNNLGELEALVGNYDSAQYYYQQAVSLSRTSDRKAMLVSSLNQLGGVYLHEGKKAKAYKSLEEAVVLGEQLGGKYELAYVYSNLADYYIAIDQPRRALEYAQKAESISDEQFLVGVKQQTHLIRSKAYEALGNDAQALSFYKAYVALGDSLKNEDKVREITKLNMQHEFDKTQAIQLAEQQQKDLLVAERLERERIQRYALIGLLGGVGIVALLLWRADRRKRQTNAILANKNELIQHSLEEKETLLREIHHRVKNNLQVISSLLSLQSQHIQDQGVQAAIQEGRNRVKSMAMIHQNLYQTDNLTGIEVNEYIDKLTHSLFQSYNINSDRVALKTDITPLNLDVDTVIPLGLILNELLTNALKYAFPDQQEGRIEVSLKETDQALVLQVADNGVGLPRELDPLQAPSMGYKLIRAFLAKLKGSMEVSREAGTDIKLTFTQYQMV